MVRCQLSRPREREGGVPLLISRALFLEVERFNITINIMCEHGLWREDEVVDEGVGCRLAAILSELLGHEIDPDGNVSRESEAQWDSLLQVELIFSVEEEFGIEFEEGELASIASLLELRQSTQKYLQRVAGVDL
jgi:acyl carrier protein